MPAVLALLFARHVLPIAASSFAARLAKGITPLAVVALVHDRTGSFAGAGAVLAAMAAGDATATPVQGRLIDRFGPGRILLPSAVVYAIALTLLAVLVLRQQPPATLLCCAFVAGAGFPPISGTMKSLWPRLTPDPSLSKVAYAAESLLQQVLLLIAPLLAAALIALGAPVAAICAAAGATLIGTAAFVRFAASLERGTRTRSGDRVSLASIRPLIAATAAQGVVFGALPVLLPALADRAGGPAALGGVLLAVWMCGTIAGSFVRFGHSYRALLTWFALALAVPAVIAMTGHDGLPLVSAALAVSGLFVTPIAAVSYLLVDANVPAGNRTEAFTWLSTALAIGGAVGAAAAGTTIEHLGAAQALLLPASAAGLAALIAQPRDLAKIVGMPPSTRSVRLAAVVAAALFLALAFAIRAAFDGAVEQISGTALYASMVYAGVVFVRPRISAWAAGLIAIGFCWAVEIWQLTGVPATLSAHSTLARLALGVRFDPLDLVWYTLGVLPLMLLPRLANRRHPELL